MISRFNYTDRQKIPRRQVRLAWIEKGGEPLQFTGTIDLGLRRPLDPAAMVFVEAYSGPVVMRFPYGTVEFPEAPTETALTEFAPGLRPHFRVKIVAPGPDRTLLAWADGITPLAPDEVQTGRRSILPVETVDLGPLVWKLRAEGNEFRLQLNSTIREPCDITVLAREPDFIALVYPAVIRQILEHLLFGPEHDSVDDDHDWLIFASQFANRRAPERDEKASDPTDDTAFLEDADTWIEDAIHGFCQQQHAAEQFVQFKKAEEPNV
jgi:hypothetical protein